jgi:hypothetical protein
MSRVKSISLVGEEPSSTSFSPFNTPITEARRIQTDKTSHFIFLFHNFSSFEAMVVTVTCGVGHLEGRLKRSTKISCALSVSVKDGKWSMYGNSDTRKVCVTSLKVSK